MEGEGGDHEILKKLKEEALALMKPTAAEEEAEQAGGPGKKRKTKVVWEKLPQGLIDYMMANPYKPVDEIPQERLAELSQEFREFYATEKAIGDKSLEYEQALIKQYLTKGYAENEIEVTDNDEEN